MTATPETEARIHLDVVINIPLEDGGILPVRQGINAIPTQTEGLVVFPRLTDLLELDGDVWDVTHVGTGRRIPAGFPDQEHAAAFANAAGPMADWFEKRPKLPRDVRIRLVRLAQEHGGTLDERIAEQLARHEAKEQG